ncbi:2-phosphosulfolactate phosphatase [Paenibacillus sp. HB172176]|uniref:2-phosphosulfolactate phosphatase n=1 Tax=Paenibacillus sp. HB172176 TaxID=2493690 RepID=UPI00143A83B0|nr:2-phosphosulfolactate phosphatase [Paenibacillus sp. HB172176]
MHAHVISSVNEACAANFHHKTAIVIDVLRATSTITAALAAGASCVIPAETVMDAKGLQQEGDILGGERFCKKIAGFHLGNSPLEYQPSLVEGRRIILTTTNGTRAIHKSLRADHVLAASLLNAEACAKLAIELRRDLVIVCAGTNDDFAMEDGLCAGLLIDCLRSLAGIPVEVNDFGEAMHSMYRFKAECIEQSLISCASGKRLSKLGLQEDIVACSLVNSCSHVPRLVDHKLI